MAKERKSPQQKKQQKYEKDHFTFGLHSSRTFPKVWKRKKTQANRERRHKSDQLLAPVKPEMSAEDAILAVGDVTTAQISKPLIRKRLHKSSTVTVGEKVRLKLEKRTETVGRRANSHRKYDLLAVEAVNTLASLKQDQLVAFVRRSAVFLRGGDPVEWSRVSQSPEPIDRALFFLNEIERGSARPIEAIRRSGELSKSLGSWVAKANRILAKDQRALQQKAKQRETTGKKVETSRRQATTRENDI